MANERTTIDLPPIWRGGGGSNSDNVTFLGEESDFITYSSFITKTNTGPYGTLNNRDGLDRWLRFIIDGTEIVISKIAVKHSISYNSLYLLGLVYGTNDTGVYVPYRYINTTDYKESPTNQYKTIVIKDKTYKIRLLKGTDPGHDPLVRTNPITNISNSEFNRLFLPILKEGQSTTEYTDTRLANYTVMELGLTNYFSDGTIGAKGFYTYCQERDAQLTRGIYYNRIARFNYINQEIGLTSISSYGSSFSHGWRPCLELIS